MRDEREYYRRFNAQNGAAHLRGDERRLLSRPTVNAAAIDVKPSHYAEIGLLFIANLGRWPITANARAARVGVDGGAVESNINFGMGLCRC